MNNIIIPPPMRQQGKKQLGTRTVPEVTVQAEHSYASVNMVFPDQERIIFISEHIPKSYDDAIKGPGCEEWKKAINKEFDAHRENKTWVVEMHPGKGKNILNTCWLFTVKYNIEGCEIPKACLVAVGCGDRNLYTEENTYTPVCLIDVVCLIIAIA